jgi:polyisoprenyl-teichoic acid--peptidoglycan teichoic acid transferase
VIRRPLLRLLITIPLAGGLVAGLLAAAWFALGRPDPAVGTTWFQVQKVGEAHFSGAPGQPFFFLALGNDGRADTDPGLGDAIHVVGVNPATHQATILNVPRDTQAPGGNKINSYHSLGGLPGIVGQLDQMMGIQIDYAITTNFPGFVSMVDEIGGIDVNVPKALNDYYSGAVFLPGPQHLSGDQALRLSRDRHDYSDGDISRTGNQALVIISALATLRAQNPGAVGTAHLVSLLARHVRMQNVDLSELFRLGRLALSIDPNNVKSVVIPVGAGSGTNLLVRSDARSLFDDFRDDAVLQNH